MKEMYLKVSAERNCGDFVDVFFRKGRYFTCPKDDEELVEIEDAENKGAEKLLYAINRIVFFINNNGKDEVEELFGHANIEMILREFAPHRIIELAKELGYHVPTQGDVYKAKRLGFMVTVLSFDEREDTVQYVSRDYMTFEPEKCFSNRYEFTGENIDVSALVNKIGLN